MCYNYANKLIYGKERTEAIIWNVPHAATLTAKWSIPAPQKMAGPFGAAGNARTCQEENESQLAQKLERNTRTRLKLRNGRNTAKILVLDRNRI